MSYHHKLRSTVIDISNSADPKEAILKHLADSLNSIPEIYGNRVLLATYIRPSKTAGGIWRPDSDIEEDRWTGKVGLVLKIGQQAFENDRDYKWKNPPKVGDWVTFWTNDTKEIGINGVSCREIRDICIGWICTKPELYY